MKQPDAIMFVARRDVSGPSLQLERGKPVPAAISHRVILKQIASSLAVSFDDLFEARPLSTEGR